MRFAYADPPYLGCCRLYGHKHDRWGCWDDIETHRKLIEYLGGAESEGYSDGWAMSCSSPSLRYLLPLCPDDCRVGPWVKPFAIFKPNVNPAFAWEPVIFRGGRRGDRTRKTIRDWHSANVTLKKGLTGAKPPSFCDWVLDLLGYEPGDTAVDLFPGTGAFGIAATSRTASGAEGA